MGLTDDPQEIERRLRQEIEGAWNEFANSSRQAGQMAVAGAAVLNGNGFWRYQRALKRLSDLVVYGQLPDCD